MIETVDTGLQTATIPTRQAFSERMVEYGSLDSEFTVFETDIGSSTYSYLFRDKFPDRYYNLGIAEANTIGAAAGMAADGRTVIACSYGVFITMRALETIRSFICYPNLNVKFLSSHAGLTADQDGVTHQATEDVGIMTLLPRMKVLAPVDAVSSKKLFDIAMQTQGPVFVRLMKKPFYDVYSDDDTFKLGGSNVLRSGDDVTIAAYGDMVFQAIQAAEMLAKENISAEVLDMYSLKPVDESKLVKSISKTGALVVVENHQQQNGLGYKLSNISIKLDDKIKFENIGIGDKFAESGEYDLLIEKYGISKTNIINTVKEMLKR